MNAAQGQRLGTGTAGHCQGERGWAALPQAHLAAPDLQLFAVKPPAQQPGWAELLGCEEGWHPQPPLLGWAPRIEGLKSSLRALQSPAHSSTEERGSASWGSQNKEKEDVLWDCRTPAEQWGRVPGNREQGSAQTQQGVTYPFSPAALAPSLPDATHNYLITKCPLVMPQTDLWKEKESKKDAGTAMLAFLLHPQSQL